MPTLLCARGYQRVAIGSLTETRLPFPFLAEMNGQINDQPVAELIREISVKHLTGRLRLQHDAAKVVFYFESGKFLYAASNIKNFRLREYLEKANLARYSDRPDNELAKVLCDSSLLSSNAANQLQSRQSADVLRLTLLWTEGTWEFDHRSRLTEEMNLKIDVNAILLEAGRKMDPVLAVSRFRNPLELISPVTTSSQSQSLLPVEGFLLSRLDGPTNLNELTALCGMPETEALHILYYLALAGLVERVNWKNAFRETSAKPIAESKKSVPKPESQPATPEKAPVETIESFVERVSKADSHYAALGVTRGTSPEDLKAAYYNLARNFHPDRFGRVEPGFKSRIESAFARITQAYDALRDGALRSSYDARLDTRAKAQELAKSAPKAANANTGADSEDSVSAKFEDPNLSSAQRAELQFKEGFAALELGQRNLALGLFASAARAVPNEPRYRAYYGLTLAHQESTKRLAEAELQAAVKLDPGNPEYRLMLAELFRDLGFLTRAKGEAERAIASDPNNHKAKEFLRNLK